MTKDLYPGQTDVQLGKLATMEAHQERDAALAEVETDPVKKADILGRIASRVGQIAGMRQTLANKGIETDLAEEATARLRGRPPIDGETRADTFRWRITPTERQRLESMAAEHGQTPSQYLRRVVFGPELQYSAWYDSGLGAKQLGTSRDLDHAEAMARDALTSDLQWVSWVIDHGTEYTPGKGEVARFSSHADAPGYNRVVRED